MQRFIKNILLILIVAFLTTFVLPQKSALAIADRIKMHKDKNDPIILGCQLETLDNIAGLDNSNEDDWTEEMFGDCSIELSNKYCSTALTAAYTAAKFGPWRVKIGAWGTLVALAEGQYFKAKDFYDNSSLCGNDWYAYYQEDEYSAPIYGSYEGSRSDRVKKCLFGTEEERDEKSGNCKTKDDIKQGLVMSNRAYREFIYNGEEYEDDACKDPRQTEVKGYDGEYQRYYMRGKMEPNYACERFLGDNDAYTCCTEKSQSSTCVQYKNDHKFCKIGSCNFAISNGLGSFIGSVELDIKQIGDKICVSTQNLCPFNHNLGGGSRKIERNCKKNDTTCKCANSDGTAKGCYSGPKNFCQLYRHCSLIPGKVYVRQETYVSPYFDRACINFRGSSKNITDYGLGGTVNVGGEKIGIPFNYQGFTAPAVQCIKETIENMFRNIAGHSRCLSPSESPNDNEICQSGEYFYQKGQDLAEINPGLYQGSFSIVQDRLKTIVRLVITFAITMYGVKVIVQGGGIDKRSLLMLAIKIALIYYFTIGTAWKNIFFDGVYEASTSLGNIVMKVTDFQSKEQINNVMQNAEDYAKQQDRKLDGCQFSDQDYGDKQYLAIFDTIDCKILKYLGVSDTGMTNIFIFALSTLLIGPFGAILFFGSLIFALFLITFVIRATYIFLVSFIAISLIVYISPIIIPLVLFEKTKNIFEGTAKTMLSFIIQPIVLYAYVGIFLVLLDNFVTGDALFTGEAPRKVLDCSKRCETSYGEVLNISANPDICKPDQDMVIVDPKDTSLLCVFNGINEKAQSYGLLAPIGVFMPLYKMGISKMINVFFSIIKSTFVIYILSSFLTMIPNISSTLTGGFGKIQGIAGVGVLSILTGSYGLMKTIGKVTASAGKGALGALKGAGKALYGTGKFAIHPQQQFRKWRNQERKKVSETSAAQAVKRAAVNVKNKVRDSLN
jgi:type IV secretory pathway VirB6-like protein